MKKLTFYILSLIAVILSAYATKTFPETTFEEALLDEKLEVTFIDVDQGDSTLIKTPAGETILIDGGEYAVYGSHLAPFLAEQKIQKVDIAVATHYHSDHMGGIYELVQRSGASHLVLPDYQDTDSTKESLERIAGKTNTAVSYAAFGDNIKTDCEDLSIKVLHPLEGGSKGSNFHNNSSLVFLISYHGSSFLITGDIESRAEQELIQRADVECDVLKVPHHGSSSSLSKSFLEAADPTYAVISAGVDNSYGHPHYEVMEALENDDIRIYRTDTDGNITFTVTEKGIKDIVFSKP